MALSLTPSQRPPPPSLFKFQNEHERIGLLISGVLPQSRAIPKSEDVGAFQQLKKRVIGHIHLQPGEEEEDPDRLEFDESALHSKKRRTVEPHSKGGGGDSSSFQLFGGAITVAPAAVGSVGAAGAAAVVSEGNIWGPSTSSAAPASASVAASVTAAPSPRVEAPPPPAAAPVPSSSLAHAAFDESERRRSLRVVRAAAAAVALSSTAQQNQQKQQPAGRPSTGGLRKEDFGGAERFCRNAGKMRNGLLSLQRMCDGTGTGTGSHYPPNGGIGGYNYPPGTGYGVGSGSAQPPLSCGLLWHDETSNHSVTTKKVCKPSQSCDVWNCACGRYVFRSMFLPPSLLLFHQRTCIIFLSLFSSSHAG
jgi:hypothetical protein